jgi:hypothetical protein
VSDASCHPHSNRESDNPVTCYEITTQAEYEAHADEARACFHVRGARITVRGSATVEAWGSATVEACDSATVKAWGSATVKAWGSATVEACDSATVEAWGSATVEACDSATVEAWGSATVKACDSATVEAWGSATVEAWGSATVKAWDSATVKAWGSATVKAWGSATVKAWGSATVEAWDSATVKAWGSATVKAWGSATVKACDSATVEACDSATVKAARFVAVRRRSDHTGTVTGGVIIQLPDTNECDVDVWCAYYGIDINEDTVVVYKAVDEDLVSGWHDTRYPIGETVTAADYQPTHSCGGGLHFGPTPRRAAASSVGTVKRYLACRIKVADAVAVGDKIKARSCEVLYEVDADGERIEAAAAAVSE